MSQATGHKFIITSPLRFAITQQTNTGSKPTLQNLEKKYEICPKLTIIFLIQVLHILAKPFKSPGTISFGVSGNHPAKICPKVN